MRANYTEMFRTVQVLPEWESKVWAAVEQIKAHMAEYQKVEHNTGIPWAVIAAIHFRESGADMNKQILNGQSISQKTTIVPKNHGPWSSWSDSAVDALRLQKANREELYTIADVLGFMEQWNGWGYRHRNTNSPYLWTGSQYGVGLGKYVADGNYSSTAEDKQVGAAVLLHELMAQGMWWPGTAVCHLPISADDDGELISDRARMFQEGLNVALAGSLVAPLVVDGWVGQQTQAAFRHLVGYDLE